MMLDVAYQCILFPSYLVMMDIVQYAPREYIAVFWDSVTDDRFGHCAIIRFGGGCSSPVLANELIGCDQVPAIRFTMHPPQCVALKCGNTSSKVCAQISAGIVQLAAKLVTQYLRLKI